jgi:hypothetical protein
MANLYDKASFIFTANAYSASRLFSIKPTTGNGDLIFSRASSKTRVNSSGVIEVLVTDMPALNYSTSLSCPTLTLEPTRTNLFWPSDTGSNASNIVSASNDWGIGFVNKNTLYNTGAAGAVYYTSNPSTIVTGSTYIISCYVKIIDGQAGTPVFGPTANSQGYFNIAGTSITGDSSYKKTPLGNNIWRVVASGSGTGGVQNTGFLRWTMNRTGSNGTGSIEVTGLQVESGSGTIPFETSYIPTTTGAVTRIGDQYVLSNSISSSMGITGTWFINIKDNLSVISDNAAAGVYLGSAQNSGTTGDSILFRQGGGISRSSIWLYTGSIQPVGGAIYTPTTNNSKIAITWDSASRISNIYDNGVRVVTSASFVPTTSLRWLRAGNSNPVGRTFNIDSMALFPTVLSDAECIALTT